MVDEEEEDGAIREEQRQSEEEDGGVPEGGEDRGRCRRRDEGRDAGSLSIITVRRLDSIEYYGLRMGPVSVAQDLPRSRN